MGPPWCGQGTVSHTTLSDLLSTDVLASPPGASVGAGGGDSTYSSSTQLRYHWFVLYIPVDLVLTGLQLVTVLLVLLPNTAVTLTVQLLPALREEMVCVVAVPLTVSDDVCCKPQKF